MNTDWAKFAGILAVKIAAYIILILFALIVFFGLFTKKAINIWGLKFNVTDTVYITKQDTVFRQKNVTGDNNVAGRDNNGVQGGHNNKNHIVNGTNNGVNGDVVNGIKQRSITSEEVRKIIAKIPRVSTSIEIIYSEDKESLNYATKIKESLLSNGYKNINLHGWISPDGFDKIEYSLDKDSVFRISVYPESNVN